MSEVPAAVSNELTQRAQQFLDRAQACEADATNTADEAVKHHFLTSAHQWRRLAEEALAIAQGRRMTA